MSAKSWWKLGALLCAGFGLWPRPAAGAATLKTEANVMVERTFKAARTYADPFNEVTLDVLFLDPNGREARVPAFWAGTNLWKVRYASPVVGTHRFRTLCSETLDKGLHGVTGKVEVKAYRGQNPLYFHGPLRVSANRRYLEQADGLPFFWLGDTWWMGLCHRLHWPDEFKELAADRKEKGFNVIQIVAGLYPDMPPFDPRGANEAGFPWETNYTAIHPAYFNAADQRILYLVEQGFTPCIVGGWGYFMPLLGLEKAKQHWRYLIARYAALPVVWCAAGEANLPWYLVKSFPDQDLPQARDWVEVMHFIRATDPFHRPLTVHPSGKGRSSSRTVVADDPAVLDLDMLQTPHNQRAAVEETVNTVRQSYADHPVMPVIDGEAAYEQLKTPKETITTEWTRRMFWLCLMNGAAGHTYGANGIWQCNRRDQPHGPSPLGGDYGQIPWDEAMNLPGSRQVGLGKRLLEQYPWQDFQPHPEWAEFAVKSSISLDGCHWIWFPEGNPAQDAPAGKRFFRRTFVLPEGRRVERAELLISADDQFSLNINGKPVGAGNSFKLGQKFNLAPLLTPGTNLIAVTAENGVTKGGNPAGLIARLEVRLADGEALNLVSGTTWLCAQTEVPGWDRLGFDDAAWTNALAIGRYGDAPWKQIDRANNDGVHAPQSTGIPGLLRLTYVPQAEPILVTGLDPNTIFAAAYFDPTTGARTALPPIQAEPNRPWRCPPPAGWDHDWVLILERKAQAE